MNARDAPCPRDLVSLVGARQGGALVAFQAAGAER